MNAQIGQVLTTYWRRAFSSRFTLLVIAIPVVGMIEAVFLKKLQISIVIWFGIYVPALIAIHFKQQIIQIRQRRIPNAVEPHVVVAVGLLALVWVGDSSGYLSLWHLELGGAGLYLRSGRGGRLPYSRSKRGESLAWSCCFFYRPA